MAFYQCCFAVTDICGTTALDQAAMSLVTPFPAAQAQAMSTPEELKRRWQVVLTYHGGSPQLWREYLRWQRAQYASFAVRHISQSDQSAVQVIGNTAMPE